MIEKICFKSKWIIDKHKETSVDPILIEKAIYAFELQGGTGLMLLIPDLKRLSIDLDIITVER